MNEEASHGTLRCGGNQSALSGLQRIDIECSEANASELSRTVV